jgi:Chaperone of endosialidase
MKSKLLVLLLLTSSLGPQVSAWAQGTAFTYQGRLDDGGSPANGSYDLTFSLFNAATGPSQLGGTLTNDAVAISNGLFTVTLDFGNRFPGADRWLQIGVRTAGGGAFATLAPRQPLTTTPYAVQAVNAGSASSVAAADLTGTLSPAQLPGIVITNGGSGTSLTGVALLAGGNTFSGNQIIGSGRLGIGTAAPANLLHLQTSGDARLQIQNTGNSFAGVLAVNSQHNYFMGVAGATDGDASMWHLYDNTAGQRRIAVKANGYVGIGTSTPASLLDVAGTVTADTSLQVGSYGNPDTYLTVATAGGDQYRAGIDLRHYDSGYGWTLVSDERDSTFQLRSHFADTNGIARMVVDRFSGNVGIGSTNPAAALDVRKSGDWHVAQLQSDSTIGSWLGLYNTSAGGLQWSLISSGSGNGEGAGKLMFYNPTYGSSVQISANGNVQMAGEITSLAINLTSDRNAKEDFKPVNPREVLDKVARLPITEWQYKADKGRAEAKAARHIGPVAQDFRQAFALGHDDKHISMVDEGGVALAAIQGLNEELEQKNQEVEALKQRVADLSQLQGQNQELAKRLALVERALGIRTGAPVDSK